MCDVILNTVVCSSAQLGGDDNIHLTTLGSSEMLQRNDKLDKKYSCCPSN